MKSDLSKLSDSYGITLELTGKPKGELRDDDWPCVTFPVELRRHDKVIWSGRYSQGLGFFSAKAVARYAKERGNYSWSNGIEKHGLCNRFKNKKGLVSLVAGFAFSTKKRPDVDDVLFSCLLDGQADFDGYSFEDFASEMGYDSDSIKAHKMYEECCETGRRFRSSFDYLELEKLREVANEH